MARGLKFRIYDVEETKGADQLRCYREDDLRLCFPICKKSVFSRRGSLSFENLHVAICYLVQDAETIHSLMLTFKSLLKSCLKYE